MTRTTTILALVQTLLVTLGFIALGIILKMSGYPDALSLRWNPLAVFLREHGLWLLFLPVMWVLFATFAQRRDRGLFSFRTAYVAGICLATLIIALFLYATVRPYTRPLFIHVSSTEPFNIHENDTTYEHT